MFGSAPDQAFVQRAGSRGGGRGWLIAGLVGLLVAAGLWAAWFEIEEVTRATGRIVPSSQVQTVETLEGGLVASLVVSEGDLVTAGQILLQIDDTGFSAQLGELAEQQAALRAQIARLTAEAQGAALAFPASLDGFSRLQKTEHSLFEQRQRQHAQDVAVLQARLIQRQAELAEHHARAAKQEAVIAPLEAELALSEDLLSKGVMPELEVLRLRARLAEEQGNLEVSRAAMQRLNAALTEAQALRVRADTAFQVAAQTALAEAQTRLAVVSQSILSAQDRLTRTALRAPVDGTVKHVAPRTIGAVLAPGDVVVEIVPRDDTLVIEANVPPRDVAFVSPEATASVKITAYDYLTYGSLPARVERISADAFAGPDGQSFFKVFLRTDQGFLGPSEAPLPIIPGMTASVDIQTGRKTVLSYLITPFSRVGAEALRER